jgi:exonuclease SbcC
MRPNQLVIEAFGPYATRAEVDFDALADTRLFVVSGPTGAGKTSIFDAMCWALYGELPGNRLREGKVRSDAADPGHLTSVSLTFTVDDTVYRVVRQPEQERPKLRGTGSTTEKQSVELHRRSAGVWEPMAHRWAETNRICADLVGLTSAQFQQVVLLPQGRFQEVLHATSDERTKLLRTLFDTAGFERAQDLLDRRAKTAEKRRDSMIAEVSRSEDTANAELDALQTLVEAQGIELPPLTGSSHTETTTTSVVEAAEQPDVVAVQTTERDAGRKRKRRGAAGPGQLSLVSDDGFDDDAAGEDKDETETEANSGPHASTAGDPIGGPTSSAHQPTAQAEVPAALPLGDRAERLELHGVALLDRRRDEQRTARNDADARLSAAHQLAQRQARFRTERARLETRVKRLSEVEANRLRLDAALRAAGVADAHQVAQRASLQLADAQTTAETAVRQTASELTELVELWPTDGGALTASVQAEDSPGSATALPGWLADAGNLGLTRVPTSDRPRLADALEALSQRADRGAGELRGRAGEIAQARELARQASARQDDADAAAKHVAHLTAKLDELAIRQRSLNAEQEELATLAGGADRAQADLTHATGLRDARITLDGERLALADIDVELAAIAQQTQALIVDADRLTAQRDAARQVAECVADHRGEAERATAALRMAKRRDQTRSELADAVDAVQRHAAVYSDLMGAFTADAAPRLAATLVDGDDCPVCGSAEHPLPSIAPAGVAPVSSTDLERAHATNMAAISKHSALQDRLDECVAELGDDAAESITGLTERHRAAQHLVDRAVAAVVAVTDIERRLTELERQRQGLEQRDRAAHGQQAAGSERLAALLDRLGDSADTATVDLETRVATAADNNRRCLAAVEAVVELDRHRTALGLQIENLTPQRSKAGEQQHAAAAQADQLHEQAAAQLSLPDANWPHAQLAQHCEMLATVGRRAAASLGGLDTATCTDTEAQAALRATLDRQGFNNIDDVEAAALNESDQRTLEASIRQWDGEGFALTQRLADIVQGGLTLLAPDLDGLAARLADATDAADRLIEHATTARNHLGRARRAITELDGRGDERTAAQADYEATYRLARMCRGHNAQRVTLEAWVLAHHLREVVTSANRRLGAMSRGRFQIHVDDEAADQRSKHGLDLSIADAETGTRRPVRTLSGGQTFQASLALALGLADTIATQRVGRDIGATFIDEGFGGLDADSLDTAIEVLNNLGAEGQMIGVITHVEELKAGVGVAIEVTPMGGGRSELTQLIGNPPAGASSAAGSSAEVA